MEPSGFLPLKVPLRTGDKLVLYPVYLCPVEILERGVFIRPSYHFRTALVNGFNRRTALLDEAEIAVSGDIGISSFETRCLEVKVSPKLAAELAEFGAVTDDFRSWRKLVRNRRVAVNTEKIRLVRHVFAVRGSGAVDTFTGELFPAAGLVDTFFS